MSESPRVEVYATGLCSYCMRAKRLLENKAIAFEEIRVDKVPGKRAEMEQRAGLTSVPQVFIDGAHVGGFSELYALESEGGLEHLLATVEGQS